MWQREARGSRPADSDDCQEARRRFEQLASGAPVLVPGVERAARPPGLGIFKKHVTSTARFIAFETRRRAVKKARQRNAAEMVGPALPRPSRLSARLWITPVYLENSSALMESHGRRCGGLLRDESDQSGILC